MKYVLLVPAAALCVLVQKTNAQAPTYKHDLPDSLVRAAKVTEANAATAAQKRVPKGAIESVALEREKGKLIYSYDIKLAGKSGVQEVNVDANTGKVISSKHESAKMEKKEAAAEAKEKAKTAPPPPPKKP
jgi:Peptidase propeptide and YPEB domain